MGTLKYAHDAQIAHRQVEESCQGGGGDCEEVSNASPFTLRQAQLLLSIELPAQLVLQISSARVCRFFLLFECASTQNSEVSILLFRIYFRSAFTEDFRGKNSFLEKYMIYCTHTLIFIN